MARFLIDENLPADLDIWSSKEFLHVNSIPDCDTDSSIWSYAIANNLIILTKDTDFYHRYLSHISKPKVVWFRIGNMIKSDLEIFVAGIWARIINLLQTEQFLIVTKQHIEAL